MAQVPSSHWQPLEITWQWLSLLTTRQKITPLYTTELTIGSAEKSTLTLVKCSRIGSSCSCIILANNSTFLNAVNQNPWTPLMSAKKELSLIFPQKGILASERNKTLKGQEYLYFVKSVSCSIVQKRYTIVGIFTSTMHM